MTDLPFAICLLTFCLSSCVPLDQLPPGSLPGPLPGSSPSSSKPSPFAELDPGAVQMTTLHFTLRGYNENEMRPVSLIAESLYNKIGNDTGLYSFLASGSYTIVVYHDREEYSRKTHLPDWSRAVTSGASIYLYPGDDLEPVLAHEMTHLIFNSYMGDKASTLRWLNEGLAMHEEVSKMADSDRAAFASSQATQLRADKMPFSQMTFFTPLTEERRRVDLWYQQVESVMTFLLAQGSALSFAAMLNEIRNGSDVDRAIGLAYPAKFRHLNELEQAWKYTI